MVLLHHLGEVHERRLERLAHISARALGENLNIDASYARPYSPDVGYGMDLASGTGFAYVKEIRKDRFLGLTDEGKEVLPLYESRKEFWEKVVRVAEVSKGMDDRELDGIITLDFIFSEFPELYPDPHKAADVAAARFGWKLDDAAYNAYEKVRELLPILNPARAEG